MPEPARGIGAVVEELRKEYPDVSVSKIRYLESRGLIEPGRSERGTRRYDFEDVERLREILRLQGEEYLPLDVIARRMELWDPAAAEPAPDGPLTASELAARSGLDMSAIEGLTTHGLLRPGDGLYGPVSLVIARGAAELLAEGLEPRHLRSLRSGLEQLADNLASRTRAVARGKGGHAARSNLIDRVEQAARLILGGVAEEEFGRLRSE